MSSTLEAPTAVAWRCAQPGLWVATAGDGRAAGIVSERWRQGFSVTSASGVDLGVFTTIEEAKAALGSALSPALA